MNASVFEQLYRVVQLRKEQPQEGSYTCYLYEKGLDKILKKVGEEAAETIIAAKSENRGELVGEICDLLYHLFVLMCEKEIGLEEVTAELALRAEKIGNRKEQKQVDRIT